MPRLWTPLCLPFLSEDVPSRLGEDHNAYPLAFIAHELDRRNLLVDSPETGTSIRRAVARSIEKFLHVEGLDDIDAFRVEWTDDVNHIHGLIAGESVVPGVHRPSIDKHSLSIGGLVLRIENEPELFCAGAGIEAIEQAVPGAGKAVWSVLTRTLEGVFYGMTPRWAYHEAASWEDFYEEEAEELEDDETEREARENDGPLDPGLAPFQQPVEDLDQMQVSSRHFEALLPRWVFDPAKLSRRTVGVLNRAIDVAPLVKYLHVIQVALDLSRLMTGRHAPAPNRVWQYAEDQQYPGFAVAWRLTRDPSTRVFDEHIDLIRQRGGEVECNIFLAPFTVPLPQFARDPVVRKPRAGKPGSDTADANKVLAEASFGEALDTMRAVLRVLVLVTQLLQMLEGLAAQPAPHTTLLHVME